MRTELPHDCVIPPIRSKPVFSSGDGVNDTHHHHHHPHGSTDTNAAAAATASITIQRLRRHSPSSSPRCYDENDTVGATIKLANGERLSTSPPVFTSAPSLPTQRQPRSQRKSTLGGSGGEVSDKKQNDEGEEDQDSSDLDDSEIMVNSTAAKSPTSNSNSPHSGRKDKKVSAPPTNSRRATTSTTTRTPQFGSSTRGRKRDTSLRDVDETVFRFWMLVEDYKRQKDKQAKAFLAEIIYSQYLAPSAESSSSPYYISVLHMPPSMIESIEQSLHASYTTLLPRNLFDTSQAEVGLFWRLLAVELVISNPVFRCGDT